MEFLLFIAGVPVGVLTSLFSWWLLWRVLSPKGKFSELIAASPDPSHKGKTRYRAKFLCTGRRPMMDVQFHMVLLLPISSQTEVKL